MSLIRLLVGLVLFCASAASAEPRLQEAFPNSSIVISRFAKEDTRIVYVPTRHPQQDQLIRKYYGALGDRNFELRLFSAQSFLTDLTQPGTALVVSSQDSASPVLDPLFQDPDINFYVIAETLSTQPITITVAGRDLVGNGARTPAENAAQLVLLVNGPLKTAYEVAFAPNGSQATDVQNIFAKFGASVARVQNFTNNDLLTLKEPGTALLTDLTVFQNPAMGGVPPLFVDPQVFLLSETFEFRDVTAIVEDRKTTTTATAPAAISSGVGATINRAGAMTMPLAVDPVLPAIAERARARFDFSQLAPDECHQAIPNPSVDRIALVVGNGAYFPNIGWLENPPNDAKDIAEMFYALGMGVYFVQEGSRVTIEQCVDILAEAHPNIDVAVLYYAGHGLQFDDQNYLLGINAQLTDDLGSHLISVDDVAGRLRQISRSTLVLLDACRNNPFETENAGLAAVSGQLGGIEIAPGENDFAFVYAAAPNAVAFDGEGANSPFTASVLSTFSTPGVTIQEALVQVSGDVQRRTDYLQQPFTRSNLTRLIYLSSETDIADIQLKAEEATAKALEVGQAHGRPAATASILSQIPADATDAEILNLFAGPYQALRTSYLAQIDTLFDLPTTAAPALVLKVRDGDRYLVIDTQAQLRFFATEDNRVLYENRVASVEYAYAPTPVTNLQDTVVAYASNRTEVVILDVETGDVVRTFSNITLPDAVARYGQMSALQLTPDGRTLLIEYSNWYVLLDVASGRQIAGFGSIILDTGREYAVQELSLQGGALCFALRQSTDELGPFFAVGKLDLATLSLSSVFSDNRDIEIEGLQCSPNAAYISYSPYAVNGSRDDRFFEIVDLNTGNAIIHQADETFGISAHQVFFSQDSQSAFIARNGVVMLNLPERQVVYTESAKQWHNAIGNQSIVYFPPNGHLAQLTSGGQSSALFDASLPPTQFIQIVIDWLPEDMRATVIAARPTMPN